MSIEEGIRRHFIPKKPVVSGESWWLRREGESGPDHRQRFYQTVAEKQAELSASRFGTLASMICGPSDAEMRSQSERWKKRKQVEL